jgi:hypothetical protein
LRCNGGVSCGPGCRGAVERCYANSDCCSGTCSTVDHRCN